MNYTFTWLAVLVCLRQRHHKHVSNALCQDDTTATTALAFRNFSASLQPCNTTIVHAVLH